MTCFRNFKSLSLSGLIFNGDWYSGFSWSRLGDFLWVKLLRDGSWWFQSSLYQSFQWISPDGWYFRHRRSTTVGSSLVSFSTSFYWRVFPNCTKIFKECMINVFDFIWLSSRVLYQLNLLSWYKNVSIFLPPFNDAMHAIAFHLSVSLFQIIVGYGYSPFLGQSE